MFIAKRRPNRPRRGVTLVEMLVVVALVLLMMVILVQIFQSATGAMSASRTTQELDIVLRSIDSMIRSDLGGVTAKMTPPNDPARKEGYFEYIENAPADLQGEDTDDILAFTTKAPEGQVFSGRQWLGPPANQNIQPITITSQVAEVIYFLRNGNLYRRVFLVAPDRAKSLTTHGQGPNGALPTGVYITTMFGGSPFVSWMGMNDISCRPGGFSGAGALPPIPNDLGDLTNRENRAFRPRFLNDFAGGPNGNPDGLPDDFNGDNVPDYYPTLYYNGNGGNSYPGTNGLTVWSPNGLSHEALGFAMNGPQRVEQGTANSWDVYAFPFIFPGMYSVPDPNRVAGGLGSVHYLFPNASSGLINHSPLDIGETLVPDFTPGGNQTWWGFPTWRETMSGTSSGGGTGWRDPINFVSKPGHQQPMGLRPIPPNVNPITYIPANLLPPVYKTGTYTLPPYSDGAGSSSFVTAPATAGSAQSLNPNPVWEDDLILTNVRSFDVKAYDLDAPLYNVQNANGTFANGPFSAGYLDLGYGAASFVGGLTGNAATGIQNFVPFQTVNANGVSNEPMGFGHEGRIPPLPNDFRYHPRRKGFNGTSTFGNIGDPNTGVIRLAHTFDTWSTDYVNAYDTDVFLNGTPGTATPNPIYPSFPAPYPSPLRGIQIQIRVVDPRNERAKVLTIRHDFSDKLTN
jgi:prepilin-type N-terminal cleavage/methylation domain-containing protein